MRPYMWTPQPVQAYRWITADSSTILSLSALAVTCRFSRGVTATIENKAPCGFQHLVQPQTWLNATSPLMRTVTGESAHLHFSVPPLKPDVAVCTPLSTAG